jgi:hypothetical protein
MTTPKKTNKVRHRRTIAIELHKQWRNLERKGDAEKLATALNVSKPTIDKALIYGCVHQQALVDGITKFFADRILAEKESAQALGDLATQKPTS